MPKVEPTVQKYMTPSPYFIESSKSAQTAAKMMHDLQIKHLPVMQDGKLFGILSERDIKLNVGFFDAEASLLKVSDLCKEQPYIVAPDTKMHVVLDQMVEHHYGCVIVVQNNNLVGIFTTNDACRAFSQVLQQRARED